MAGRIESYALDVVGGGYHSQNSYLPTACLMRQYNSGESVTAASKP